MAGDTMKFSDLNDQEKALITRYRKSITCEYCNRVFENASKHLNDCESFFEQHPQFGIIKFISQITNWDLNIYSSGKPYAYLIYNGEDMLELSDRNAKGIWAITADSKDSALIYELRDPENRFSDIEWLTDYLIKPALIGYIKDVLASRHNNWKVTVQSEEFNIAGKNIGPICITI